MKKMLIRCAIALLIGILIGKIIIYFLPKNVGAGDSVIEMSVRKLPLPDVVFDELSAPPSVTGIASWYDYTLKNGWSSKGHLVCAARDWPRYTYLKVVNLANGRSVICKITDFGPDKRIHPDRIVDLSSSAYVAISDLKTGIIEVKVESYGAGNN